MVCGLKKNFEFSFLFWAPARFPKASRVAQVLASSHPFGSGSSGSHGWDVTKVTCTTCGCEGAVRVRCRGGMK
jgi:hypothetical protein